MRAPTRNESASQPAAKTDAATDEAGAMSRSARRLSGRTRRDTASSAAELRDNLIRRDRLPALSFIVAASYRGVEAGALFLIQIITVVEHGQIDLGPFRSIVRLIKLQPTLMNRRLQLQHGSRLPRGHPHGQASPT